MTTPRRTELVWAGKRTQVERIALPFQRAETVNAPRGDLFSTLGGGADGWRNKLIWGDNKLVMASLLQGDPSAGIASLAGKIDLIYIDPPFDTGADFSFRTQVGDEEVEKEASVLEHLAYRDTWGGYIIIPSDDVRATGACTRASMRNRQHIRTSRLEACSLRSSHSR